MSDQVIATGLSALSRPDCSATQILATADEAERMAATLASTGDYRILRRLRPLSFSTPTAEFTKRGVFVDVETTGLDASKDAVIELGMVPFDYTLDGTIVAVGEPFGSLRDPGIPIPAEITALTGITDEMVRGVSIDPDEVSAFIDQAALVISHNASFDRPFCQREWPLFATKAWACSLREIDWAAEGFSGKKLSQIAAGYGLFFDAHRAVDDCHAGVDILTRTLPRTGRPGFAILLQSARTPRWRLWAEGAPYVLRETLKARGYRWSAGEAGSPKAWYLDVGEDGLELELHFLRREIYSREDVKIPCRRFTALDRYAAIPQRPK
jgi:DNA polymerase III subunit epsilon